MIHILWCAPRRPDSWGGWLLPFEFGWSRLNGRRTLDVCVGFVWSGFIVVMFERKE